MTEAARQAAPDARTDGERTGQAVLDRERLRRIIDAAPLVLLEHHRVRDDVVERDLKRV